MITTILIICCIVASLISDKKKAIPTPQVKPSPRIIPVNQHQHKCPECQTIWAHGYSFVVGKDGHTCPTCGAKQYSQYLDGQESDTLGEFLLSRYMGALIPQSDTKTTRFKFQQQKPPLLEVREILIEYYESIGWKADMVEHQQDKVEGLLHQPNNETSLTLLGFYDQTDMNTLIIIV